MKVLIFTEGGTQYGYGHIFRCMSLYSEIEQRGIDVEFIVRGDNKVKDVLSGKNYKIVEWLSKEYLSNVFDSMAYSIVDSYHASRDVYEYISERSIQSVYIDDNARITYPKGIVVNPSLNVNNLIYPENSKCEYLLGHSYIILRDSFINLKSKKLSREIKEILITMGGSDVQNLTPIIIKAINDVYPEIKLNIIIGNGFTNLLEIKKSSSKNVNLYFNVNDEKMAEIMLKSDLAITAAGQTIYELMRVETPFIPIQVINNQSGNVEGIIKHNLASNVLCWNDSNLISGILNSIHNYLSLEDRQKFTQLFSNFIDGLGRQRIINSLLGGAKY